MTKAEKNMIATLNVAMSALRQARRMSLTSDVTDKNVFSPAIDDIDTAIVKIESLIERIDPEHDIAA